VCLVWAHLPHEYNVLALLIRVRNVRINVSSSISLPSTRYACTLSHVRAKITQLLLFCKTRNETDRPSAVPHHTSYQTFHKRKTLLPTDHQRIIPGEKRTEECATVLLTEDMESRLTGVTVLRSVQDFPWSLWVVPVVTINGASPRGVCAQLSGSVSPQDSAGCVHTFTDKSNSSSCVSFAVLIVQY